MRCWRCCLEWNSTQTRGVFSSCGCIHSSHWLHPEPVGFFIVCPVARALPVPGHTVHCDTVGAEAGRGCGAVLLQLAVAQRSCTNGWQHLFTTTLLNQVVVLLPHNPATCTLTSWVLVWVSGPGEVTEEYVGTGTAFYCKILHPKLCYWEVTGEQLHWLRCKYCCRKLRFWVRLQWLLQCTYTFLNPLQAADTGKVLLGRNYNNQAFCPQGCMLLLFRSLHYKKGTFVSLKFVAFPKLIANHQPKSDDLSEEGA